MMYRIIDDMYDKYLGEIEADNENDAKVRFYNKELRGLYDGDPLEFLRAEVIK